MIYIVWVELHRTPKNAVFQVCKRLLEGICTELMDLKPFEMQFLVTNCEIYSKKGIERIPRSSTLHSFLAFVYLRQNRKNDAKNEMKKALALNPKDELAQILLGMHL